MEIEEIEKIINYLQGHRQHPVCDFFNLSAGKALKRSIKTDDDDNDDISADSVWLHVCRKYRMCDIIRCLSEHSDINQIEPAASRFRTHVTHCVHVNPILHAVHRTLDAVPYVTVKNV